MSKKVSLGTYLAHAGICSRRKADLLVRQGLVCLNHQIVLDPGMPVLSGDQVLYQNKLVLLESKIYILLNKPLNYLSAVSDLKHGRPTVIDLVKHACKERLYPVGRLDYQTTGLLLLTNDGDFAHKLAHPKYEVIKIYSVTLNVNFKLQDLELLKSGVYLKDGLMQVDDAYYDPNTRNHKIVQVVIHSGKNRIVRRLFEFLGYQVVVLDRICYAGLSKNNLKTGQWRFLSAQEILNLTKK
jgi:23S rRNA pseudouridine2605 synthase